MLKLLRQVSVRLAMVGLLFPIAAEGAFAESAGRYMKRVTNELVAAARKRSAVDFAKALRSHGDVKYIGLNALGTYSKKLPKRDRPAYFTGMVNWIARYVASEAPKYPIKKAYVTGQTRETRGGAYVDTQVHLTSGTICDVRWKMRRRSKTWKVQGAEIVCDLLPFPVQATDMLGKIFQDYIAQNGHNPRKLVVALNN